MFRIRIYDSLFFAIPVILLIFLGISLYRYISAKKKNTAAPKTFSPEEMKTRKIILIIASILAGIFITIVVGFMALMFMAVAFM